MARVKFNANKAKGQLKKRIEKALEDKGLERQFGEFLKERVKFEARRGTPLNNDRGFPDLAESTKENRERLARFNRTHRAYRNSKSNVTLTGQLVNALKFERVRPGIFEFFVDDSRRTAYRTGRRTRAKASTNAEVDGHLREKGFVLMSAKGLRSDDLITRRLKEILLRFLKRSLKSA